MIERDTARDRRHARSGARSHRWRGAGSGARRHAWSGGALVAVTAAAGLLTGLRALVRVDLPRLEPLLGLQPIPREGLGVLWSVRALWPADVQEAALARLLGVVCALVLSAVLVAALNALMLLAESATSRRAELAVRSAVGATRPKIVGMLLRELRALLAVGMALGLLCGMAAGGIARAMWPDPLASPRLDAPADLMLTGLAVVVLLAGTYVRGALRAARPERAAAVLRSGTRTGADPVAVFARKALTAGHTAVAGALLVATLALSGALATDDPDGAAPPEDTVVLTATSPRTGAWSDALGRIGAVPGVEAESLAAPGALIGLGIRAVATAECGRCSRGLMPAPLWNALADHHAVSPGFFELAGIDLVEGRVFAASDGPGSEPVVVINETFARSSFERGDPLGKRVRIGEDLGGWYRVVGVVADQHVSVLGAHDQAKEVVYMSALQRPPRRGTVLLRASGAGIEGAVEALATLGFEPGPARSLARYRADAAAPLSWAYHVAAVVALLALLLAAHGVYATALQTTRRRIPEIAIRSALGASRRRIVAHVLLGRLRVVGWGLAGFAFLGTLAVGLLRQAAGMPPAPLSAYGAVAAALAALATVASARAAREAGSVEPAALLE